MCRNLAINKTTSSQLHHLWWFFLQWTLPLLFELAMECVYPFGEGIVSAILMTAGNVVLLFFYVAFMLPHSDVRWMNWVTVLGLGVCVLGLLIYQEMYTRLDLDTEENKDPKLNACR